MANAATATKTAGLKTIVAASAAGTTFEWYDFFIFGTLTASSPRPSSPASRARWAPS
ncbi:MAG: hypothetical protein WDN06_03525 [Asticcacaulis sp.]